MAYSAYDLPMSSLHSSFISVHSFSIFLDINYQPVYMCVLKRIHTNPELHNSCRHEKTNKQTANHHIPLRVNGMFIFIKVCHILADELAMNTQ